MKHPWSITALIVAVAALAACSSIGGGALVPSAAPGRAPMLRAIPVYTPAPSPAPQRSP